MIEDNPFLASFNLISLADALVRLERYDHAERVMRKATRLDPGNNEVWYAYAKTAWRSGKQNEAAACLTRLLQKNARYYRAQLAVDPIFSDLFTMITRTVATLTK